MTASTATSKSASGMDRNTARAGKNYSSDQDLSPGTPVNHPSDEDLSSGTPVKRAAPSWTKAAAIAVLVFALATAARTEAQEKASADFQRVEALIAQRRFNEAKTATLEQLKQHPSSVEGYNLLGIIETNQQNYADALASFEKALQLNPRSVKTLNNIGNLYVAQQQPDLAEKEFRAVLRLDPANSEANYNLGVLLLMKGAPADAIPHLERVRPMSTAAQFNLVRAYFQTKRTADALRAATELSEQSRNEVQVHFSLGVLLASEKQYKAAQLELEKADALQPETFEIIYNLGQARLRNGDFSNAQVALNRALKIRPDSADAMYLLAQVYIDQSRPLDALDLLVRAHKLAPENVDILFLMGQVSMSQNYYEDAIPVLESGLQIAPKRPDLLASLGESYFMAGKIEKAIEIFNQLVQVDTSARSYAFIGLSYRNLGRFDEAKEYFEKGLKLDPHNATCLFNLGFIAERQGDAATAEATFQQTLQANPDYPDALLELANMRIAAKKYAEAEELLRKFVRVSRDPATGYYKLAMVERSLHETAAAERDLNVFKTLSKNTSAGPMPYEHLFDYLDNRSKLAPGARDQLDVASLENQTKIHPDQPQDLYLLAEAYLKSGRVEDARNTIAKLDKISAGDYRTLTGTGVLLARYRLYDDAIQHFQAALAINPADEVKFNLANAYFRKRQYTQALEMANQVSEQGRKDDAYLTLSGDIYAHLGDNAHASEIFRDAIARNPDNDQNYLSLALIRLRTNDVEGAEQTLSKGQARIPASGKIFWGLGLTSAMKGKTAEAARQFERAVDLLPEWPGGYSTLGVFYFQIGQVEKAKETLNRFKESSANASLDISRIEQVLERAPAPTGGETLTAENKQQLLQLALSLADRTL
jgi:tetratricopeptide (TPR) repeat protein